MAWHLIKDGQNKVLKIQWHSNWDPLQHSKSLREARTFWMWDVKKAVKQLKFPTLWKQNLLRNLPCKALEALHCRAARIIFELPWEMSNVDVMKKANWSSLAFMYKISLAKLMYKIYNNLTPDAMSAIIKNNDNTKRYQLRKKLKIDVPRFNTNYMRNSVARRGAIVWNTLVPQLNDDIDNVKKYAIMARRSKTLLHLDFDCISPQTLTRREEDFKYN